MKVGENYDLNFVLWDSIFKDNNNLLFCFPQFIVKMKVQQSNIVIVNVQKAIPEYFHLCF